MPQEMKKVNGRWVVTGSPQSSDLVPFVKPKAAAASPAAKPKPAAKPSAKPWWAKLGNDALYELKQLAAPPLQRNPLREVQRAVTSPLARAVPQQIGLGVVGAVDNTNRMAYSLYQRHVQKKPKADPGAGRAGELLDSYADTAYRLLGATPPSQMNAEQREADLTRRSLALNAGLALIPGAGLGALGASTALGTAARGGAAFALNELASNYLDDNTGGNIVNLINQLSGAKLPGGVDVGNADMVDAANQSLVPNTAAGVVLGGVVGGGASAFRNIQRRTRAGREIEVVQRARAAQEDAGLIEKAEDGSYRFTEQAQQPMEPAPAAAAPAPAQAAPAASPMDEFKAANAAMEEQLGMRPPEPAPAADTAESFGKAQPGELPQDDLAADPWDVEYDPALPESDALGRMVDELSDQELITIANNPGLPVVERVNQTIEARAAIEAPPPMSAQMVMAPTDRLADDYLEGFGRTLEGRDDYQLRPLFDPETNPQLWQRAQGLSGVDDPSQLSKVDMLDTFRSLSSEGQTPITNRLMGAQMLPTGDIKAAPLVFQYKGGVNEAGEQIGNSLEGLERWDPASEGIIQVWRDVAGEIGAAGQTYVVNGHNRLAAASRMGIPSLRVEYLDAPSAAEARRLGAVANVSAGSGTVFDAAKLAREMGITDEAQMVAKGKPGSSGFWRDGIALSRLPEDIFLAAVNEQIKVGRAVIIGKSGADEETMRSAYRYLVQQGPDNVSKNRLRQMMAMATRSPAPSSAAADQPDILTGTEWGQQFNAGMLAKADLATAVEQMLKKEKKLFGTVGKSAGQIERVGQVDAAAAKEISGEASRALALFEQMKFESGPIGELLNDNVSRVVSGQTAAEVARSMKNRLVVEIKQLMGQEVAPATDVVQEDMFAAAGRGADDDQGPIELAAEERAAAKAKLLQEAISAQEVRPPSTPIPELPEPARVRADEAVTEMTSAAARSSALDSFASQITKAGSDPDVPGASYGPVIVMWDDGVARKDFHLAALEFAGEEELAQIGLTAADVAKMSGRQKVETLKRSFDEAKAVLPPGEYLLDPLEPSLRGAMARMLKDEPGIEWFDLQSEAPSRPSKNSYGIIKITGGAGSPAIDIPEAASRKITAKTDENRIIGAAERLAGWTRKPAQAPMPLEKALALVRAKGALLDIDKIPGIDGDAARNDASMGRATPDTEAVAQALKQFYGVPEPAPTIRPGSKAAQAMADEVRLAVEYGKADALNRWDQEEGLRDAFDYETRSFDEKKDLGVGAGYDDVLPTEVMSKQSSTPIADAFAAQLRGMAESDARLFRTIGEMQQVTRQAIDELSGVAPPPVRPEPLRLTQGESADVDTRGKGVFYHGTANEFELNPGGEFGGDGMNIYGDGLYVTDDLTTAAKYQKKNRKSAPDGAQPVVYRITENEPVKFYNLDKPVTKALLGKLRKSVGSVGTELFEQAIEEAGPKASLAAILDEMRGWSREFNLPAYEVQEIFQGFTDVLEQQGFGGFAHQGGNLAGKGKRLHQVRVYWNPAERVTIEKVDIAQTAPPPTKAGDIAVRQQIEANNQTMDQIRRKAQQEGC
jgi:hypothetical protein